MIKPGQLEMVPGRWSVVLGPRSSVLGPWSLVSLWAHTTSVIVRRIYVCTYMCTSALLLNANLAAWQINILANLLPTDSCQLYNHHQTMAMGCAGWQVESGEWQVEVGFWLRGVHRPQHYLPGERESCDN